MLHRPEKKENRGALALGGKGGKQNCWDGPAAAGREPQQLSWVLTNQQDWPGFTRFRIRCKSTILCSAASHLVGWALGCAQRENHNGNENIWEFPKIRSTLFWGPYNKDPTTLLGYHIRVPYFRKLSYFQVPFNKALTRSATTSKP